MTKFTKEELGDFMNAETARHNSMLPQLRRCFKEIEEAVNAGSEETTVIFLAVYPEVAEALIEMGYDVTIEESKGEFSHSSTSISWKRGNKTNGKLETVNN